MGAWWIVAAAHAMSVDETRLAQLRDQVAPAVEAALGRRLVERPPVRIETEAGVLAKLGEATQASLVLQGVPEEAAREQASVMVHAVVDDALAVYDNGTRTIYVVEDHLEGWLANRDVADAQFEPVCACVLAHELAHALQQQYAAPPPGDATDLPLRRRAIEEGQAEVVQTLVCAGRLAEAGTLLEEGSPAERLGAAPPAPETSEFLYDYGSTWVADLWRREGAEAVWAALQAPPTHAEVVARVATLRSDPWWRTDWIGAIVAKLAPGPMKGEAERVSLRSLTRGLWAGGIRAGLPRSGDGMVWAGEAGASTVLVGAWTLPDTRAAATFLTLRGRELEGLQYGGRAMLFTTRELTLERPRVHALKDLPGGFLFQAGKDVYNETWILDGARLLLVVTTGQQLRARPYASLLASILPTVPAPPAPAPPVAAAGTIRETPPAWSWWARLALDDARANRWGACAAQIDHVDATVGEDARAIVAKVGHPCAVAAEDLALAARFYSRVGDPALLPESSRVGHGLLLGAEGRPEEMIRFFDGWSPTEPGFRQNVAEARIHAAIALRSWSRLAEFARDRAARPETRGWAANGLMKAGRLDAAARVLATTCPDFDGTERARCEAARLAIAR